MQNDVPNASIPPSNLPPNSPQPKKSNAGLVIAIIIIVLAFSVNFFLPMVAFYFIANNVGDFIREFEDWEYEYDNNGSSDYIGFWVDDLTKDYVGFSDDKEYIWVYGSTEEPQVETGKFTVARGNKALENQSMTISEVKRLFGFAENDESFDVSEIYDINLLEESESDDVEPVVKRSLLIYHRYDTILWAYDAAVEKTYIFSWQSPYSKAIEDIFKEDDDIDEDEEQPVEDQTGTTETSQT